MWMCGVKVTNSFMYSELKARVETVDIITVAHQNRLTCYGHISRKDENDCVEMHGLRSGGCKM